MPTYEFLCEVCGPFEQRRNIQEASDPMACPTCLVTAQRIYSTAGFILTSGTLRRRIEQSAEPKVVTRPRPEAPPSPPRLHQGMQSRPWQLGHAAHTRIADTKLQHI